MRYLPYVLVAAMAVPVLIWVLINSFVIHNSSTFTTGDVAVLVSLGGFMVAAFVMLSKWMSKHIDNTPG